MVGNGGQQRRVRRRQIHTERLLHGVVPEGLVLMKYDGGVGQFHLESLQKEPVTVVTEVGFADAPAYDRINAELLTKLARERTWRRLTRIHLPSG